MNLQYQLQQTIDMLFNKYDRNMTGTLDMNELPAFMNEVFQRLGLNYQLNMMQAQQIMRNVDQNCDYQANRQEIQIALMRYINTQNPGFTGNPNFQGGMGGYSGMGGGYQQTGSMGMGGGYQQMGNMGMGGMGTGGMGMGGMGGGYQQMGGMGMGGGHGRHQHWNRCQFRNPREEQARDLIDQIYMRYDRDGSGSLDQMEFPAAFNEVLGMLGIGQVAPQQAMMYMQQVDRSGNGRVERPEFFACVQRMLQ